MNNATITIHNAYLVRTEESSGTQDLSPLRTCCDVPVTLENHLGSDTDIVAAARVCSSPDECKLPEDDKEAFGLINYLMKHRHGSPFEHGYLRFHVHAPIFVWREWHRHRIGFCLAGDSVVDFVDSYGTRSPGLCRTVKQLYTQWTDGEVNGIKANHSALTEALTMVQSGSSIRAASRRYGVARGTLERRLESSVSISNRDSQWRIRGMNLRVLNEESLLFTQSGIEDVIESGVKELVNVQTASGKILRCSRDHRILTDDGWTTAGELRKGDRVAIVGRRSRLAERNVPPSLRRGIGVWTSMQRNRLIKESDRCYICGNQFPREMLVLDHVVPVVSNLETALHVNNLKPACEPCHRIKSNGEQKLAKRGNVAGAKFSPLVYTPTACGEEMTYDISVKPPHHNFVANGIVVHNSYNEQSGRYTTLPPLFYLPHSDRPMFKVDNWKPGRPKFESLPPQQREMSGDDRNQWTKYVQLCCNLVSSYQFGYNNYIDNLKMGFDPGLARDCLPVGIYSACVVSCNPRSLMAFLSLRTHEPEATFVSYPLYEIELAARKVEALFAKHWPLTYKAFCENGRVAP